MGSDSVVQNPGQIWGGDNSWFHHPSQTWDAFNPSEPEPTPPPGPPDSGKVRQGAVNSQIQGEQQMRASRTLFTGGSGLLDQPTTASRVLIGS